MTSSQRKKDYLNKLPKIVDALKKGYQPEKIILFGSLLDPAVPSNDIDLFMIKDTKTRRLGDRANEAREFVPFKDIPIDLIVYTQLEADRSVKRGNVFIDEILEEGRVLYEK